MAKFSCDFSAYSGADLDASASLSAFNGITADDLLSILRPAAERLAEFCRTAILRRFKRRTGSLADSFKLTEFGLDRGYMDLSEAGITVGPKGKHKGSSRAARSRAGSPNKKYAKHNRKAKKTSISNAELGYLLEYGTPRIAATHWMESANEEIESEIQDVVESGFNEFLERKGL